MDIVNKTTFKFKIKVRANGVYKRGIVEVTVHEKNADHHSQKKRDDCRSLVYQYANHI